jgi:NAD(P)-dependent dehydrogenase (short-subunit alcohol dehydrogenase family)
LKGSKPSTSRGAYAILSPMRRRGLEGFTQNLAAESHAHGIRVNSVEPGYVAIKRAPL